MFTFSQWVDLLVKARGHKYIKRIPYMTPKGRRYRYIYNVTHSHQGKHAMDESHLQVGTAFMVHTESGAEVHGHIKSISGDRVTYVLDDGADKGKEVTKTKSEIVAMLNEKHNVNEQVQSKRDALKRQLQTARDNKASEAQLNRIQQRIDRLGGEQSEEEPTKGLNSMFSAILEKHRVSPEDLDIKKWYKRGAPRGFKNGEVSGNAGNTPDASMYRRLMGIADRREEVCAKYNAGLEKSLSEIQERVAPLLAKQEKLNKEIETLKATPTELDILNEARIDMRKEIDAIAEVMINGEKRPLCTFSPYDLQQELILKRDDPAKYIAIIDVLKKYGLPAPDSREFRHKSLIAYSLAKRNEIKPLKTAQITEDEKRAKRKQIREQQEALNKEIEAQFSDLMFQDTPDDYDEVMGNEKINGTPRVLYMYQGPILPAGRRREALTRHSYLVEQFESRFQSIYPELADKSIHLAYTQTKRASSLPVSFGSALEISTGSTDRTIVHECAHSLEYHVPHLVDMVTLSISKRVQPNKRTKVTKSESAFEDEFHSDYTGKLYNYKDDIAYTDYNGYCSSEVITMGMQEMLPDRLARLLSTDLHHFAFTYGVMKGHFK